MDHEFKELDYDVEPQFLKRKGVNEKTAIYVIAQNKGGVGKTSLAVMITQYLTEFKDKRVLVIDLDPQGNISSCYVRMEAEEVTQLDASKSWHPAVSPDFLSGDIPVARPCFTDLFQASPDGGTVGLFPYATPNTENIQIIPAFSSKLIRYREVTEALLQIAKNSKDINAVEEIIKIDNSKEYRSEIKLKIVMAIAEMIGGVREQIASEIDEDGRPLFDYIIFDTPPDKSLLVEAACISADHVIFPFLSDAFNSEGSKSMFTFMDIVNHMRESAGGEPCKVTFQPNCVNGTKKKQLRDLNIFGSSDAIKGKINYPLRQIAVFAEMLMYKPDDISLRTHFKGAKPAMDNVLQVMGNIFDEEKCYE
jgi:cellulose biosynthesis protein BcsQ